MRDYSQKKTRCSPIKKLRFFVFILFCFTPKSRTCIAPLWKNKHIHLKKYIRVAASGRKRSWGLWSCKQNLHSITKLPWASAQSKENWAVQNRAQNYITIYSVGNYLKQPTEKLRKAVVVLNYELCVTEMYFCSPGLLGIWHLNAKWVTAFYRR